MGPKVSYLSNVTSEDKTMTNLDVLTVNNGLRHV